MRRLGASIFEIEPGATAFPRHYHCANEEAIYVFEGEGILGIGDSETPLRPGDFVALPRGREHAHRLDNRSQRTLRYLCFSTMIEPDIAMYSVSNKSAFSRAPRPAARKKSAG